MSSPLQELVAQVRDPAARRVATPLGDGYLWQVFLNRVGVVLDSDPEKVAFFDPISVAPTFSHPPGRFG